MKNLDHIIEQMRNTAQISRIHAKGATIREIADIANTYADLFEGYVKDLEHANQLLDMQSAVAPKALHKLTDAEQMRKEIKSLSEEEKLARCKEFAAAWCRKYDWHFI